MVDAEDLDSWRGIDARTSEAVLELVAEAMLDTLLREESEGQPVHSLIGIDRRRAAALLAFAFGRAARYVLKRDLDRLPRQIVHLKTIVQSG
jgi:hypothetical protein